MKQAFRLVCAVAVLAFFWLSYSSVKAQNQTPPPSPFIAQITSSNTDSFAGDMSGNGRFVVIESVADIATEKNTARNNLDGNREIFLYDYAQRRVFQITNTKSQLKPSPSPSPTPSPSPSPSPTPTATPTPIPLPTPPPLLDPSTVQVDVSNNRPVISNDGKWILFTSNADNPSNFDGNVPANAASLAADGNQEIWMYRIPDVTNTDLSTGADVPFQDLASGTFTRITNTPASALPQPGTTTLPPTEAFDNRDPAINDDGTVISFISSRNLTGGNSDGSPEVFVASISGGTPTFAQITNTPFIVKNFISTFTENPSLSGDGTVLSFISNANIPQTGGTSANADGNAEVYVVKLNGLSVASVKQVTNTIQPTGDTNAVTVLSPGRRLSRNGLFLALESRADLDTNATVEAGGTVFLYDITANTFKQIGPRPTSGVEVARFPVFTGDSSTLIFDSALNFKTDGSAPATAADGLNPSGQVQLFSVPVSPPSTPNVFTVLTNTPPSLNALNVPQIQTYTSNTLQRSAINVANVELGGGNADGTVEVFYLHLPPDKSDTPASSNALSFFTGASNAFVVAASPATTPSPPNVPGLTAGMIGLIKPSGSPAPPVTLAPAPVQACSSSSTGCASELARSPDLPVELEGVSVSVNGGAAGLYFASPGQINFVVPIGLGPSTTPYELVVNNNGTVTRGSLILVAAQPDIFTSTNDAGGRAVAVNVTNPMMGQTTEPFNVTSTAPDGTTVPTVLQVTVTGMRFVSTSQVTVTIGTTAITGSAILVVRPLDMPGMEQIQFQLPASLAGAGDVPIVISVTNGGTFTSRPTASAPHITIN